MMKTIFDARIDIEPVPASRPRVTRWGTYYGKRYTRFRKEIVEALSKLNAPASSNVAGLSIEFICPRYKTVDRPHPKGDLDNLAKGVLDGLQEAGMLIHDDKQVMELRLSKRFTRDDESPHIHIKAMEVEHEGYDAG